MKIKSMLNLSEATVILDTVDLQSVVFQNFLKKNSIKATVVNKNGPGGGFPEVEYTGSKKALDELVHQFFGDDDLKDLIEEGIGSWMQDSGWIKGGKKRDPRGVVTHASDVARRKTAKENFKLLRVYAKDNVEVKMFSDKNNDIWIDWGIEQKKFSDVNAATKWLEGKGYKLRDLHEGMDKPTGKVGTPSYHTKMCYYYEDLVDQELRKLGEKLPKSWDASAFTRKLKSNPKYKMALKYYNLSEIHGGKAVKK
jgi:hypothetical protein